MIRALGEGVETAPQQEETMPDKTTSSTSSQLCDLKHVTSSLSLKCLTHTYNDRKYLPHQAVVSTDQESASQLTSCGTLRKFLNLSAPRVIYLKGIIPINTSIVFSIHQTVRHHSKDFSELIHLFLMTTL